MMKSLPVQSNSQLVKGGNHIYLSSYTGNTDSSCHHRMETVGPPSAMFQHYISGMRTASHSQSGKYVG